MENGYQSFAESFRQCCERSCTRLAYERQQTEAEYAASEEESRALYDLIGEKLGEEQLLINRFDAAKNQEHCFDEIYIYQQGFQDCVYVLRWMGLL